MHSIVSGGTISAEVRWEKTKNWRSYSSIQESEQIEVLVEGVGKMLVQCEFICSSQV